MAFLNSILDWLYYSLISPFFITLNRFLSFLIIQPMQYLHFPLFIQVSIVAVLTAVLAFYLRGVLKVDEKVKQFNTVFARKRKQQQHLQLISDKYSRAALYSSTDDELNDDFNTYLAAHYARYVTVYLLPLFFVLAWLNTVYSEEVLTKQLGIPFVLSVPANQHGINGLSVTFVFLLTYIVSLIIGFQIRRMKVKK